MRLRAFLLAAALLALSACGGGSTPTAAPTDALGQPGTSGEVASALEDEALAGQAMALLRASTFGGDAAAPAALEALPGRRVFACSYQEDPTSVCATGVGGNLAESFAAAGTALKAAGGTRIEAGDARLKFDVTLRTEDHTFKRKIDKPKKRDVALYGYWIVDANGQVGWVLPSELLEKEIFSNRKGQKGIARKKVEKHARKRNPDLGSLDEEFAYTRFWTIPWVEKDGEGVFRLYRLHPHEFASTDPDVLLQRIVWAQDYLMSSVSADGKIRYTYKTARDRDSSSYNLLRHGGTTYSMLQAYDRTRYEPYLRASEQAFQYLFKHTDTDERTGPFLPKSHASHGTSKFIVSPGGKVKLGGAGLALVMIDQYVEATGDTEKYRTEAVQFARFLAASQTETGEFLYFPPRTPGGPLTSTDGSAYYPGEAILGLIRLYSWDKNPLWLETAVRAADWLIDVRDKGKDERRLANDHWLMLALSYLYHYTQDQRYVDHSMNLCRAVEYQYNKNKPAWENGAYPDFQGGYYDPPRSTPAATRGEGLGAVLDTCALAGRDDCDWIEHLLQETVRHEMLSQYDPDMMFWIRNRKKAFGGWNGGLLDMEIRNDFVQHNMSSLIGLERHIRRQSGTVLPGGPGYTERALAGEVEWSGVPKEQLDGLRADTVRYRGSTRWETAPAAPKE
ncbi:MAG: hypothetical protein GY898_13700 [Proteobacteria bacterium]|nr:hypothetical protein [Pseudomonadota bacterium]